MERSSLSNSACARVSSSSSISKTGTANSSAVKLTPARDSCRKRGDASPGRKRGDASPGRKRGDASPGRTNHRGSATNAAVANSSRRGGDASPGRARRVSRTHSSGASRYSESNEVVTSSTTRRTRETTGHNRHKDSLISVLDGPGRTNNTNNCDHSVRSHRSTRTSVRGPPKGTRDSNGRSRSAGRGTITKKRSGSLGRSSIRDTSANTKYASTSDNHAIATVPRVPEPLSPHKRSKDVSAPISAACETATALPNKRPPPRSRSFGAGGLGSKLLGSLRKDLGGVAATDSTADRVSTSKRTPPERSKSLEGNQGSKLQGSIRKAMGRTKTDFPTGRVPPPSPATLRDRRQRLVAVSSSSLEAAIPPLSPATLRDRRQSLAVVYSSSLEAARRKQKEKLRALNSVVSSIGVLNLDGEAPAEEERHRQKQQPKSTEGYHVGDSSITSPSGTISSITTSESPVKITTNAMSESSPPSPENSKYRILQEKLWSMQSVNDSLKQVNGNLKQELEYSKIKQEKLQQALEEENGNLKQQLENSQKKHEKQQQARDEENATLKQQLETVQEKQQQQQQQQQLLEEENASLKERLQTCMERLAREEDVKETSGPQDDNKDVCPVGTDALSSSSRHPPTLCPSSSSSSLSALTEPTQDKQRVQDADAPSQEDKAKEEEKTAKLFRRLGQLQRELESFQQLAGALSCQVADQQATNDDLQEKVKATEELYKSTQERCENLERQHQKELVQIELALKQRLWQEEDTTVTGGSRKSWCRRTGSFFFGRDKSQEGQLETISSSPPAKYGNDEKEVPPPTMVSIVQLKKKKKKMGSDDDDDNDKSRDGCNNSIDGSLGLGMSGISVMGEEDYDEVDGEPFLKEVLQKMQKMARQIDQLEDERDAYAAALDITQSVMEKEVAVINKNSNRGRGSEGFNEYEENTVTTKTTMPTLSESVSQDQESDCGEVVADF